MEIDDQDVTVWLAWRAMPTPALIATLSPDEHARAGRYRDPVDADAFTWARGLQRTILGTHLSAPPDSLQFVQDGDGKPTLARAGNGCCEYNASHSGELLALAISSAPVGVDIERARPMPGLEKVARRVFDPATSAAIAAAPDGAREPRFFTAWTALEAHAKLHGHGVWRILSEREQHGITERVHTALLEVPAGYFGAVAVAGAPPRVTVRWWAPASD